MLGEGAGQSLPDVDTARRLLKVLLQRLHHLPGGSTAEFAGGALELLGLRGAPEELPPTSW